MSLQPHPIQAPRPIFWLFGGVAFVLGIGLLAGGISLRSHFTDSFGALVMIGVGGILMGAGGRMLVSCYIGLRKSKKRT